MGIQEFMVAGFLAYSVPLSAGRDVWTRTGLSGAVTSVSVDPSDSRHLLAAAGAILESRDEGRTWSVLSSIEIDSQAFRADVIRAAAGEGILYVIGSIDSGFPNSEILVSVDGGATWRLRLSSSPNEGIPFVVADPSSAKIVYSGFNVYSHGFGGSVLKSVDTGSTWDAGGPDRDIVGGEVEALAISLSHPDRLYLGTATGTYMSHDAAMTWEPVTNLNARIYCLVIDGGNPDVLYAALATRVIRSDNGGMTWSSTLLAGYFGIMATHPAIPGAVFAAAGGTVFSSLDYGGTWESLPLPTGAVIYDLAFDGQNLFAATNQGLMEYAFVRVLAVGKPPRPIVVRRTAHAQ
jgi:photosystem II stability/assembly factor-like uncharacterized protein